jgi:hypothetical protein
MKRNCAALAIDGRNVCGAYGFAAASRLGNAQNTALRQCYQYGGRTASSAPSSATPKAEFEPQCWPKSAVMGRIRSGTPVLMRGS